MNKIERRLFQGLVLVLAVICFIPGGIGAFGGINASAAVESGQALFGADSALRGFADNQYRFGFGVFFAQGLVLLYFLRDIRQHSALFRFVGLSLFVGGLARVTNLAEYGVVSEAVIGPTVVELIVIPLLVLWHRRVLRTSN